MREMRASDPTHFSTTKHEDLVSLLLRSNQSSRLTRKQQSTLADRPPSLAVIRVDLDGVLYCLHASLAYFRSQEKDADGWRGKFIATGSNA